MSLDGFQQAVVEEAQRRVRKTLVVEAAAGSGKTRVLVAAVHAILASGIAPRRVVVTTFTREAAHQLKARLGDAGQHLQVGTSHALALRWSGLDPKYNVDLIGGVRGMTPSSGRVWGDVLGWSKIEPLGVHGLDIEESLQGDYQRAVERLRTSGARYGADPAAAKRAAQQLAEQMGFGRQDAFRVARAWEMYEDLLRHYKAHDFEDVIQAAAEMVERGEIRLPHYTLVDEAQDTNPSQHRLFRALARDGRLILIGDPWQAIYGFRGAALTFFEEMAKDGTRMTIPTNYRSGSRIVELSAKLSERDIQARADAPRGLVQVIQRAEVAPILRVRKRDGADWREMACLARTNMELAEVEAALFQHGIPVASVGKGFWKTRVMSAFQGYVSFACGSVGTLEGLRACANMPKRFLGTRFCLEAHANYVRSVEPGPQAWIQAGPQAWIQALRIASFDAKTGQQGARALVRFLENLSTMSWPDAVEAIVNLMMHQDASDAAAARIQEILKSIRSIALGCETAADFLDLVEERIRVGERARQDRDRDAVQLYTIHGAKGLEWPVVFLLADQTVLPHPKATDLEEERRLAYVGVTRGIQELHLVASQLTRLIPDPRSMP